MICDDIMARDDFKRAVEFHGHFCPGLAIGYRASRIALDYFGEGRSEDEELVAVVENDACGVDAVQALTGCTFGKGNLIHKDYGKQVFYFFSRQRNKGIRISLKKDVVPPSEEARGLFDKARESSLTKEEARRMSELQHERACKFLEIPKEELFEVREVATPPPEKARIMASEPCEKCGEPTMVTKLREINGKRICLECALESKAF